MFNATGAFSVEGGELLTEFAIKRASRFVPHIHKLYNKNDVYETMSDIPERHLMVVFYLHGKRCAVLANDLKLMAEIVDLARAMKRKRIEEAAEAPTENLRELPSF